MRAFCNTHSDLHMEMTAKPCDFPGKLTKNHKFHEHQVTNGKIAESIDILSYIISN